MINIKSISASKISAQLRSSRTLVDSWDTFTKLPKVDKQSIRNGKPAYNLGKDTGNRKLTNAERKRDKYFNNSKK